MNTVHIVIQNGCVMSAYTDINSDIDIEVYDLDVNADEFIYRMNLKEVNELASSNKHKRIY